MKKIVIKQSLKTSIIPIMPFADKHIGLGEVDLRKEIPFVVYDVSIRLPENCSRVLIMKNDIALICYGCAWYNEGQFFFDATTVCDEVGFDEISDKEIKDVRYWCYLPKF